MFVVIYDVHDTAKDYMSQNSSHPTQAECCVKLFGKQMRRRIKCALKSKGQKKSETEIYIYI